MNRRRFRPAIEGTTLEPRCFMSGLIQQPPYVDPLRPGATLPDPGDAGSPPGDYRPTDPGLC